MANQSLVRHVNERRLLSALRLSGPQPRAALARRLGLTRGALTGMAEALIARGLVREGAQTKPQAGRPGIDLELDPEGAHFLGVEIGVGVMRLVLLDLAVRVAWSRTLELSAPQAPETVADLVADALAALQAERPGLAVRSLCVTVPGLVRRDGFVVNLPILGWKAVGLAELLAQRIALPVRVENNANAAAFGTIYAEPRPPVDSMVYLKLGTGCGGAVIVNDRLLRGTDGLGSELGHLRIADTGPLCSCGQRGCLETFVNLRALQRYGLDQEVDEFHTDPGLPQALADKLAQGDVQAERAVSTLAGHLGRGLVEITNIFNPAEIVLGGAMLPILDAVTATLAPQLAAAIVPGMTVPRLSVSRLGPLECALGAAAMAHHEAFDVTNLDLN